MIYSYYLFKFLILYFIDFSPRKNDKKKNRYKFNKVKFFFNILNNIYNMENLSYNVKNTNLFA